MGADLYITKIHEPLYRKYEPLFDAAVRKRDAFPVRSAKWRQAQNEVGKYYDLMYSEGYFRDSYNATDVLWTLGFSWWSDVIPLLNETSELTGQNLKIFRDKVADAQQHLPIWTELEKAGASLEQNGGSSLEEWHEYFVKKRNNLLSFLDQAIAAESPIRCSL